MAEPTRYKIGVRQNTVLVPLLWDGKRKVKLTLKQAM